MKITSNGAFLVYFSKLVNSIFSDSKKHNIVIWSSLDQKIQALKDGLVSQFFPDLAIFDSSYLLNHKSKNHVLIHFSPGDKRTFFMPNFNFVTPTEIIFIFYIFQSFLHFSPYRKNFQKIIFLIKISFQRGVVY